MMTHGGEQTKTATDRGQVHLYVWPARFFDRRRPRTHARELLGNSFNYNGTVYSLRSGFAQYFTRDVLLARVSGTLRREKGNAIPEVGRKLRRNLQRCNASILDLCRSVKKKYRGNGVDECTWRVKEKRNSKT
jgi:hypothetical protein